MAKQLKNIFVTGSDAISQGFTINAKHVSQSVEAFTAQEAYDISISGSQSITGSLRHKSTGPDGTVKLDLKLNNDPSFKVVVIDTSDDTLYYGAGAGTSGSSGTSGTNGTSGSSGAAGSSGTSGTDGTSGSSGVSGTSGTSGAAGADGDKYATTSSTSFTLGSNGSIRP